MTLIFVGNSEYRVKVPKSSEPTLLYSNIETTVNSDKSFQVEKTEVGVKLQNLKSRINSQRTYIKVSLYILKVSLLEQVSVKTNLRKCTSI